MFDVRMNNNIRDRYPVKDYSLIKVYKADLHISKTIVSLT